MDRSENSDHTFSEIQSRTSAVRLLYSAAPRATVLLSSSSLLTSTFTSAYMYDLFTHNAKFDGNVHGVVVHANIYAFSGISSPAFCL